MKLYLQCHTQALYPWSSAVGERDSFPHRGQCEKSIVAAISVAAEEILMKYFKALWSVDSDLQELYQTIDRCKHLINT